MTTLTLIPPAALINSNQRLHFHAKAKLTRAWRDMAHDHALYVAENGVRHDQAHITVAFRFPTNRRRDVGNLYPTAKAIVDGLVDAGLLPDDDDKHITGPDMRREYPNGPLRVTVTITQERP